METLVKHTKKTPVTAWEKQIDQLEKKILARAASGESYIDNSDILYTQTVEHLKKNNFKIIRNSSGAITKISWE